jgi:hypothetical protein
MGAWTVAQIRGSPGLAGQGAQHDGGEADADVLQGFSTRSCIAEPFCKFIE